MQLGQIDPNVKLPAAVKAAEGGKPTIAPFASSATLAAALKTERKTVTSSNVAGIIPGSDPKLKDEVVVLSAHLDHVGVGKADTKGDTIHNGAMDNAMGIASLIEEAKRFQASGKPPRRSIMFLAVTAEDRKQRREAECDGGAFENFCMWMCRRIFIKSSSKFVEFDRSCNFYPLARW